MKYWPHSNRPREVIEVDGLDALAQHLSAELECFGVTVTANDLRIDVPHGYVLMRNVTAGNNHRYFGKDMSEDYFGVVGHTE